MLKFEYRTGLVGFNEKQLEDALNKEGARGFRFVRVVNGIFILERIGDPDEDEQADKQGGAREERAVAGPVTEFNCGCGCGTIGAIPDAMIPTMQKEKLHPYVAGHGPHPEERQTYLAAPMK